MTKTSRGIADRLRHNIEVRSPRLMALLARLRDRHLRKRSIDDVFGSIYRDNSWGSEESISGAGSEREGTRAVSEKLPELLAGHGVRSMLDAPCGDFLWMSEINLGIDQYYGVEIVPELVDDLNAKWGSTERLFSRADITRDDLPTADLLLCRDCLVHLSYDHASAALRRFRASGARRAMINSSRQSLALAFALDKGFLGRSPRSPSHLGSSHLVTKVPLVREQQELTI